MARERQRGSGPVDERMRERQERGELGGHEPGPDEQLRGIADEQIPQGEAARKRAYERGKELRDTDEALEERGKRGEKPA